MTFISQDALDYSNQAQYRVCADTRCLTKKRTIQTTVGISTYDLEADVISLLAVLDGSTDVPYMQTQDALAALSAAATVIPDIQPSYYSIGSQIGFLPTPQTAKTYTIFYEARPAPLTSATSFEVAGDFEFLIDRLVQAMKLADDGQPELAREEQAYYDLDAPRLKRIARREGRSRMALIHFDSDT
jgi:hypothetical protein